MRPTVREPGNLSCENVTRTASNRLMASPFDILYSGELAFVLFRAQFIGIIYIRPSDSLSTFSLLYSFVFIFQTTNGIIEGVDTFFLTVSVSFNWRRRLSLCFSLLYLSDLSFVASPDISTLASKSCSVVQWFSLSSDSTLNCLVLMCRLVE
jgi:hypothetical protein